MKPGMDSQPPKSEAAAAAAADWLARRESGSWTDADEIAFEAWLDSSIAHRVAYIRLDTAWKSAARLKALGAGVPAGIVPERGSWGDTRFFKGLSPMSTPLSAAQDGAAGKLVSAPPEATPQMRAWLRRCVPAAAALVLAIVAGGVVFRVADFFGGDRYTTPVGGLNDVRLVDGSRIVLNTDTRVRVALAAKERRIDLDRGEAFFQVAKDGARPFVVYARNKRVVAVGTQFSVRLESNDVQVVVTEGAVKLAVVDSPDVASPPALIKAGAIARTSKTDVLVREQTRPEAEDLLSWRNGYVVFHDITLAQAVAEFNRYNVRKIEIADPRLASLRIGGNFRANNTEAFLWLIESGFSIDVERGDDKVVLRAR